MMWNVFSHPDSVKTSSSAYLIERANINYAESVGIEHLRRDPSAKVGF